MMVGQTIARAFRPTSKATCWRHKLTSVIGTKQTFKSFLSMSAFGVGADIEMSECNFR